MGKVFKSLYGPVLGLIVDGKQGFFQGAFNAANAYFGNPQTIGLAIFTSVVATLTGSRAPSIAAAKINVKISDPPRWINGGRARSGGGALFGEFDGKGRFWYIIVHSDEILHTGYQYYLDDEPVTLDGSGYVYQKEFRLKTNKAKDPAESDGQGRGYVRIWTTTYSETDPTPPRIAALDAAFPSKWTSDHRLVGTTFSVICIDALDVEHRYKIYRWRGPFGLGEPSVSIAGDWANIYDPRDGTQVLGDRTTYKASRNAALVWAWFRTHKFGRNKPESSVNWDRIAEQADICDQTVSGIEGTQKRYEAGVAIVDSKRRVDAEREILLAMDGQIVFDEDGKSWVRAGHWEAPTLSFSRNRDIMAMASVEAQGDDTPMQGVIVNYMEPDANYTVQPSAAWINPLYYDPLTTPKFLTVDIQACQNHNQAMRLAKGIGMRSQPRHKIAPKVNLRGLQARHERIVTVNYDNTFNGNYEVAAPVELDSGGIFTAFGAVPISSSRWTLLPGEEQPKPVVDGSGGAVSYPAITGESVYYSEGAIKIDFPIPDRDDVTYVAEYILTSEITGDEGDPWRPMSVNVNTAVSGLIPDGDYTVRYRYVTSAGNGPAWEYTTLAAVAPLPPPTLLELWQATTVDTVSPSARAPTSLAFEYMVFFAGPTTTFADAVPITDQMIGSPGEVFKVTEVSVAAGWRYYWAVAFSADDVPSTPTGPLAVNVGAFDFMGGALNAGSALTRPSPGSYRNSAASLAIAAVDVARLTYDTTTLALRGLLIEPSDTNSVPNNTMQGAATGVLGSGGAIPTGWTFNTGAGLTRTVVGTGQANGVDYIDIRFQGTATATSAITLQMEPAANAAIGDTWIISAYIALVAGSLANVSGFAIRAGGQTGVSLAGINGTLARYSSSTTFASVTSCNATLRWNYASVGAAVDFTLRIGLPQRELGGGATSVIKTTGSAASRSADQLVLDWTTRHLPDGSITLRYTFDDLSTQDVATAVASGHSTVPTNLNRSIIRRIEKV